VSSGRFKNKKEHEHSCFRRNAIALIGRDTRDKEVKGEERRKREKKVCDNPVGSSQQCEGLCCMLLPPAYQRGERVQCKTMYVCDNESSIS
jgi:hypothetical protein